MKVSTSYLVRNMRIPTQFSYPNPSKKDLVDVIKHISWIAGQRDPRVEVSES
jgi:hypothetical protein